MCMGREREREGEERNAKKHAKSAKLHAHGKRVGKVPQVQPWR